MGDLVVIAVPTYRRPNGLRQCLSAIAALNTDAAIEVVVAENDVERREGERVCQEFLASGYRFPLRVVPVAERGVVAVRNTLAREAIRDPAVGWIAMIDDDEWPTPGWIDEMLRVAHAYGADVVGGPVDRSYEIPQPPHVVAASEGAYASWQTGPVDLVDATSNILFRAGVFRELPEPWFDSAYALLGGEDRDFLIGLEMAGRRFAWAREAVVREVYPASRCTLRWMVKRAYRGGNTDMLINLKRRPPGFSFARESAKILGATGVSLANLTLFGWKAERRVAGMLLLARVSGKLSGLLGIRYQEYRTVHGS